MKWLASQSKLKENSKPTTSRVDATTVKKDKKPTTARAESIKNMQDNSKDITTRKGNYSIKIFGSGALSRINENNLMGCFFIFLAPA